MNDLRSYQKAEHICYDKLWGIISICNCANLLPTRVTPIKSNAIPVSLGPL